MARTSWTERLRQAGRDPDPRFTFANERTFLAWIRTALALVAAGIALQAFVPELVASGLREVLAAVLVLLGAVAAAGAFRRWYRSELALRTGGQLPPMVVAPWIAYATALVAVAALVLVLVGS